LIFSDLLKGSKKILDVGCGTGQLSLFLAEQEPRHYIIGIDPVKGMIKVAKQHVDQRNCHGIHFVLCDGRFLPFRHSCFDALVSRGDAFVFLVPQKTALSEFKKVLNSGGAVVIEIDNVRWTPGEKISCNFEKMLDGSIAYSVEQFDVKRNHTKVFYVLNPHSMLAKQISEDTEFTKVGRLQQSIPIDEIKKETVEIRHGPLTHWPTVDGLKMMFNKAGFKNIEILGNGLLMGLLLDGDQKTTKIMKMHPRLFFEIERKLIRAIDPRKAYTIILKATVS
jgi:ubiquinone/menaquinone biosynthesis C-methylase UbiE